MSLLMSERNTSVFRNFKRDSFRREHLVEIRKEIKKAKFVKMYDNPGVAYYG